MKLASSINVYLKTTDTCNLNCDHCFTSGSKGKKIFFNPDKSITFFKNLKSYAPHIKDIRYIFHGGEPLLAPLKDLYAAYEGLNGIFENTTFGMQTNLVFNLTDEKRRFLKHALYRDGFGTSWDYDIRFTHNKQKELWEKNVQILTKEDNHYMTMIVCLTKKLIQEKEPIEVITYAKELGFKHILFERITSDGHAKENSNIIPSNREQDEWLYQMFKQTLEYKTYETIGNMFLAELVEGFIKTHHIGNRCRNCEESLLTINASGSISGCPNTATEKPWGHIDWPIESNFNSPLREQRISCEKFDRPKDCYQCDAFSYCNSDCYQLAWDENQSYCPAPKKIWQEMIRNKDIETYKLLSYQQGSP